MKILFITDRYPPHYEGGYELNCEITARGLTRNGHNVVVLTSNYGVKTPMNETDIYRTLYCLHTSTNIGFSRRLAHVSNSLLSRLNYFIAKKIIHNVKPDLAFIWRMGSVSFFPISAVQAAEIPVVYSMGDYWLLEYIKDFNNSNLLKKLYRDIIHGGIAFRKLDISDIVSVSEALKKSYVDQGVPANNITVISRGIPEQHILPQSFAEERRTHRSRMLYAGRIVPEKGAHIAITAIHYLVNTLQKEVTLDLIGSGPPSYLNELNSLIERLGLAKHVVMKGQITRDSLFDAYLSYDIMLMPVLWEEPLGNTVIEAMARGLPVIASRMGGIPEIITNGMNGLLVAPNDPYALAEAMLKLMEDANYYHRLREAGLLLVRQKYAQDVITDRIEKHLLQALMS
ncbi:MAG TPA: glycosyltransferase family 4 protein [Negativicutes bacterium]|jgi:glycosyltransferase involved in cell wall biosynthesis